MNCSITTFDLKGEKSDTFFQKRFFEGITYTAKDFFFQTLPPNCFKHLKKTFKLANSLI